MLTVTCPFCQKVLASNFNDDRARRDAVRAKEAHDSICGKARADSEPTRPLETRMDKVVLHDA